MFRSNALPPSSRSKSKPAASKDGGFLVDCSASSTLRVKAVCYAKTSVNLYQSTECHIPEDSALHILAHVKSTSVLVTDIKWPKYYLQDVVKNNFLNMTKSLLLIVLRDANSVFS
jgi:hypothetical protein